MRVASIMCVSSHYSNIYYSLDEDPLDLSLESGPLDDLSFQLDNVQFSEFPSNQPSKSSHRYVSQIGAKNIQKFLHGK